jgi:hypothetical protein
VYSYISLQQTKELLSPADGGDHQQEEDRRPHRAVRGDTGQPTGEPQSNEPHPQRPTDDRISHRQDVPSILILPF